MNEKKEKEAKKKPNIIFTILKIIISLILLPIIFVNIVIIADSIINPDEIPSFFGWKPFIVMSGSMEEQLYSGDLAIVKEVDPNTIEIGDIITYRETKNFAVTHRVVGYTTSKSGAKQFITKGDNNNTEDVKGVDLAKVEGKYVTKVSKIGSLLLFIQRPEGTVLAVSIPILLLLLIHYAENRQIDKEIQTESDENKNLKEEIERLRLENERLTKANKEDENNKEQKDEDKKN